MKNYKKRAFALSILIALLCAGCDTGPSCEEQGGRLEFTHMMMVPMYINKVMIMQQYPQYECKFD